MSSRSSAVTTIPSSIWIEISSCGMRCHEEGAVKAGYEGDSPSATLRTRTVDYPCRDRARLWDTCTFVSRMPPTAPIRRNGMETCCRLLDDFHAVVLRRFRKLRKDGKFTCAIQLSNKSIVHTTQVTKIRSKEIERNSKYGDTSGQSTQDVHDTIVAQSSN